MSLLRILRNLAVLLILAVAVLASAPRSAAGGDGKHPKPKPPYPWTTCGEVAHECGSSFLPPCCPGLACEFLGDRAFCENPFDETIE